jgi:hypothetical protein
VNTSPLVFLVRAGLPEILREGAGEVVVPEPVNVIWKGADTMVKHAHGVVRGRTIELTEDPGVAEGQVVEITINAFPSPETWGEGLRRCAGAFAADWTDEDDQILEEIYRERKRDARKEA